MPQTHTTPGGAAVTIPAYSDVADAPKAFIDFADTLKMSSNITISTVEPTPADGADGDIWMVY